MPAVGDLYRDSLTDPMCRNRNFAALADCVQSIAHEVIEQLPKHPRVGRDLADLRVQNDPDLDRF